MLNTQAMYVSQIEKTVLHIFAYFKGDLSPRIKYEKICDK